MSHLSIYLYHFCCFGFLRHSFASKNKKSIRDGERRRPRDGYRTGFLPVLPAHNDSFDKTIVNLKLTLRLEKNVSNESKVCIHLFPAFVTIGNVLTGFFSRIPGQPHGKKTRQE